MAAWTTRQDAIIRERGHLGVAAVREAIRRECGVEHSERSIEVRASRIHASLKVRTVCPDCGVVGLRINRQSGLCARCTEQMHLEEERAFNEVLQAERDAASDEDEIAGIRRERVKMRQRNSRLARRHGLRSRRERSSDCE